MQKRRFLSLACAGPDDLANLALWCQAFTPLTAPDPPDGVMLDITGCAHLFDGEAGLIARLAARLPSARMAVADTAAAAWGLARYGKLGSPDILLLPLAALRLAPEPIARLRRIGVRTIGQLARLPRAGLVAGYGPAPALRLAQAVGEAPEIIAPSLAPQAELPLMSAGEEVVADYRSFGLSLRAHPCALLRDKLTQARAVTCRQATQARNGTKLRLGGVVIVRQRPGTAKGTVFITIEDETGIANLIVWPSLVQSLRQQILGATLLIAEGRLQRSEEGVTHITVERLADRSGWITGLDGPDATQPPNRRPGHPRQERIVGKSRDFH